MGKGSGHARVPQEQPGLKLESATAPYDTIVIDHAEKPSEDRHS
jgi:uncharacterized protein (TIGR03435 family)